MKETKNKNIILIALSICLVVIMLIVYFSTFNVAKGTYGFTMACNDYGYTYASDGYCCPYGTEFVNKDVGCKKKYTGYSEKTQAQSDMEYNESDANVNKCDSVGYDATTETWSFACYIKTVEWQCNSGQIVVDNKCVDTVTIKFYNGVLAISNYTVTCVKGEECKFTVPPAQSITINGYRDFYNGSTEYTFTGWGDSNCLKEEKTGAYSAGKEVSLTLSENKAFYACYQGNGEGSLDKVIVTLNPNGGDFEETTQECYKGSICALNTTGFTRSGYTFKGWSKTPNGEPISSGSVFDENTTLYAVWETVEVSDKKCNSNSGTYNTEAACKKVYSGYTCKTNDDGCWIKGEKISGSTGTGGGSTGGDGGSGNTGGNSNTTPTTPSSDPSSSSSSSSSSSVSSSSSSSNATINPKTGAISIFIIWIIALGTIVYAFYYFRQSKFE